MPLFIERPGVVADWLDTNNHEYTIQGGLKTAAVRPLAAKVQSECRWKLLGTRDAKVQEVLNLYVGASADEAARRDAHRVHYKNDPGTTATWNQLADFILDVIATQSNRLREIEMAMIVAKSPLVMATINTTILGVEKMMTAVRLSRGASLTSEDYKSSILTNARASSQDKTYLPWTQNKTVDSVRGQSDAGFTLRMALLHDLMEFSVSMFKSEATRRVFGFPASPTNHAETVTTAEGVENRDATTEPKSIQYAKSLHCPVECGPSYTTTRLVRLPDILSILTSKELADQAAKLPAFVEKPKPGAPVKPVAKVAPAKPMPEPADPMKKMAGVKVVPFAPGYLRLSTEQKTHIAWGILGWWTLNFPKHWGTGAHCFFEVSDAARSCGAPIVSRPGVYPTRQELCTRLMVEWTNADTAELARRKAGLLAGTEQAHVGAPAAKKVAA